MVAAYEDSFIYVGTRRNGGRAFLVHFFGHKKNYKVEIQLLVGYFKPRGGIGYCADQGLLRLTPFPTARRRDSNGEAVEPIPRSADT